MSSSFFGLNIAKSGLFASQRGLQVISHNISNANTEGYSRQRVDFVASSPDALPASYGTLGTGTDSLPVRQIRDDYLDYNFRGENAIYGEYSTRQDTFKIIEGIINEPSASGVTKLMDQFYSSLQELNKTPDSLTTRALVRQREVALVKGINSMAEAFKKQQADINFEVGVTVDQINGYSRQIAKLNEQIFSTELDGGKANDMRDQRNLILDKMSEIAKISYFEDSQNQFHVAIQGHEIVNHFRAEQLTTVQRTVKAHPDDTDLLVDVQWSDGSSFQNQGGKLKGLMDMRDGITEDKKGLPYYISTLNDFIDTMATELNNVHSSGFDLNKGTGTYMFTTGGMDTATYKNYLKTAGLNGSAAINVTENVLSGTTAAGLTDLQKNELIQTNMRNIIKNNPDFTGKKIISMDGQYLVVDKMKATAVSISKDLDSNLNLFAASSTLGGVPGNGVNALALADVRHNVSLYDWGSADDFLKTMTSNLGVDSQESIRVTTNQKVLLDNVTTRKDSLSGVSLDEEMAEMLKFQHAYNANAKILTTMDGLLDTIINRMGQ